MALGEVFRRRRDGAGGGGGCGERALQELQQQGSGVFLAPVLVLHTHAVVLEVALTAGVLRVQQLVQRVAAPDEKILAVGGREEHEVDAPQARPALPAVGVCAIAEAALVRRLDHDLHLPARAAADSCETSPQSGSSRGIDCGRRNERQQRALGLVASHLRTCAFDFSSERERERKRVCA